MLYRSQLSGRRVLVVLDNARDAAQVWPLLPGSAGCLVLTTSRNPLPSLAASAGAQSILLDLFSAAEATQLLAARLGQDRLAAEPLAAQEIIVRCARLPLALTVVAARAGIHPDFPLTRLAKELGESRDGLDGSPAGTPPPTYGPCCRGPTAPSPRRRRGCSGSSRSIRGLT